VDKHCHVVVDGTGLKVYGDGEPFGYAHGQWKVRIHGAGRRRVWRKLHLAVDADTHDILSAVMSTHDVHDTEVFPSLFRAIEAPVERLYGDGAYDTREVYDALIESDAEPVIPPRASAIPWEPTHPRTRIVRHCDRYGRKSWKRSSGYHRRSLAETALYRYKQLINPKLASRDFDRQAVEAGAGVAVINKMNSLGMPIRAMVV
jgi:hypothetical protein